MSRPYDDRGVETRKSTAEEQVPGPTDTIVFPLISIVCVKEGGIGTL